MANKHTPGPWTTEIDNKELYGGNLVFDANHNMICDCNIMISESQDKANAKLIAAAPELFEALQACLLLITEAGISNWTDMPKVVNAIKKATE